MMKQCDTPEVQHLAGQLSLLNLENGDLQETLSPGSECIDARLSDSELSRCVQKALSMSGPPYTPKHSIMPDCMSANVNSSSNEVRKHRMKLFLQKVRMSMSTDDCVSTRANTDSHTHSDEFDEALESLRNLNTQIYIDSTRKRSQTNCHTHTKSFMSSRSRRNKTYDYTGIQYEDSSKCMSEDVHDSHSEAMMGGTDELLQYNRAYENYDEHSFDYVWDHVLRESGCDMHPHTHVQLEQQDTTPIGCVKKQTHSPIHAQHSNADPIWESNTYSDVWACEPNLVGHERESHNLQSHLDRQTRHSHDHLSDLYTQNHTPAPSDTYRNTHTHMHRLSNSNPCNDMQCVDICRRHTAEIGTNHACNFLTYNFNTNTQTQPYIAINAHPPSFLEGVSTQSDLNIPLQDDMETTHTRMLHKHIHTPISTPKPTPTRAHNTARAYTPSRKHTMQPRPTQTFPSHNTQTHKIWSQESPHSIHSTQTHSHSHTNPHISSSHTRQRANSHNAHVHNHSEVTTRGKSHTYSATHTQDTRWYHDEDRIVYISWIPKRARASTTDKRVQAAQLCNKLKEILPKYGLCGLKKVLLFPPKGLHCKLIFDTRVNAANFIQTFGGEFGCESTEKWKIEICAAYQIKHVENLDKTSVTILWAGRRKRW